MNLRELLILKTASGGGSDALVEKTATGNPVAFTTQIAKPVKSITVPLSYTQAGSGDPSPSNVRPITGVSSFTFTHNNSSIDVVFPAEPGTVYGGSLDLVSGVLTLTHKIATVTSAYVVTTGNNAPYRVTIRPFDDAKAYSTKEEFANNIVSDKLKPESTGNWHPEIYEGFINNTKNLVFGVPDTISSVELADAWLAEVGGINVVYELETPITIQLDPHSITAIKGTNTFLTDTTGDLTIKYLDKA